MINQLIQLISIFSILVLIAFHMVVAYAARRASRQTTIPIPDVWERIMVVTFFLLLSSLAFMILVRP